MIVYVCVGGGGGGGNDCIHDFRRYTKYHCLYTVHK